MSSINLFIIEGAIAQKHNAKKNIANATIQE